MCSCGSPKVDLSDTFYFNDDADVLLFVNTSIATTRLVYRLKNGNNYVFGGHIDKVYALSGDVNELLSLTRKNEKVLTNV